MTAACGRAAGAFLMPGPGGTLHRRRVRSMLNQLYDAVFVFMHHRAHATPCTPRRDISLPSRQKLG